ncbi:four-carbon acid sugar kinase family protein [Nocardiopsis ansamitocini]|uniref:Four-carbon acid sugar kinase family protein n=1 Tax=Nocardiopsis ansamitocini TaxID=1670832 RepID=A0A9W6UI64_9ACTN|nr:four-carbon acid sugar kinase family protein [Nocardiopsis ansamitocini]GLU47088.1 hypothetical protein Nans01_14390 [Nocardiopsis ansamitocini]
MRRPAAATVRAVSVIADDMTGAGDSALQFVRTGWEATLLLSGEAPPRPDLASPRIVARSTDVRAADRGTARTTTARAVRAAMATAGDRVYLKIDSTGRGSLGAQVRGALDAWGEAVPAAAVVCPAYPEAGRTVVDGSLRVDGGPATGGAAGRDPVTPLTTDDLAALTGGRRARTDEIAGLEPGDIAVVDARTRGELDAIAAAVRDAGPRILPVGSAGLAGSLGRAWNPAPASGGGRARLPAPTDLVFVTSLHPVSSGQIHHAATHGAAEVHELPADRVPDPAVLARLLGEAAGPPRRCLVLTTPRQRDGADSGPGARDIAQRLGEAVAGAIADRAPRVVGLVGGDGAHTVLAGLGASAARVLGAIDEGMPILVLDDGLVPGLVVWTKAGGFGGTDLFTTLFADSSHR